jgi:putative ABC transport system permease protein
VLKTTLAGLRAHLLRLVLTALAITLGVGFVSGTFVLTDTMKAGFNQQFTASADKVSVAIVKTGDSPEESVLPEALLAKVRPLPGVLAVHGQVRGAAPLIGQDGKVSGDVPTLGLSIPTGPLQRYKLASGRLPTAAGQVVLDSTTARRDGFHVGDTVKVLDPQSRPRAFTVAGLMDFGVDQEINFRGAVGFTPDAATQMTGKQTFTEIDLKAAPGTTNQRLRSEVESAVGEGYYVMTSSELAQRLSKSSGVSTEQLALFFLTFALVALFVSALVIYNTFNILIAQRTREMALLRCVGATRSQVFRGILLESVVVGLVASALGVLAGVGLGAGGAAIFASAAHAPTGPLTVSALPLIVGMVAGTLVTLVAALLPARAATRVPPIAALTSQIEGGRAKGRAGVIRIIIGGLAMLAGLGLIGAALASDHGQMPFLMVLAGAVAISFGVIALSPIIVRRLGALVGWLPARLLGVPGQLARENVGRNPKRAAITTIALTVGVTLMTMFSVGLASTQATAEAKLTKQFPVDYQLGTQSDGDQLIPRQVAANLRSKPQLAGVIERREANGSLSGDVLQIGALSAGALGRTIKPEVVAGSITDLPPGSVVLEKTEAESLGVGVGRQVSLKTGTGTIPLKVAGIVTGDAPIPNVTITDQDFDRAFGAKQDSQISVVVKKGVSADESRQVIDEATKAYPMIKVQSLADVKSEFTKALNQLFVLVGALLGLAVLISLIGIANTLTLSVVERTRESALLRAVGLTKQGLRGMLSLEALILAVTGALLGVVLGTGFGWAALSANFNGAVLGFPVLRIVGFIVVAGLAGLLAAVIPSRRAAKASIVESLAGD